MLKTGKMSCLWLFRYDTDKGWQFFPKIAYGYTKIFEGSQLPDVYETTALIKSSQDKTQNWQHCTEVNHGLHPSAYLVMTNLDLIRQENPDALVLATYRDSNVLEIHNQGGMVDTGEYLPFIQGLTCYSGCGSNNGVDSYNPGEYCLHNSQVGCVDCKLSKNLYPESPNAVCGTVVNNLPLAKILNEGLRLRFGRPSSMREKLGLD